MARLLAPFASLAALTACTGEAAPDAPVAPGDSAGRLFAAFVAEEGQGLDGCFRGLPPLDGPAGARFARGDPPPPPEAANRLVMAIDSSGSMAAAVGGERKMDAAKRAAMEFLAGVPQRVEIGLIAFGHRGSNRPDGRAMSCRSVETLYPVGAADRARLAAVLAGFDATGWTPLAAAIEQAGRSFTPGGTPGAQIVYVVSDGVETCGGDPVAAARALHEGEVQAVINIIGFDIPEAERVQLRAVAAAGGGRFIEVRSGSDLGQVVARARRGLGNDMRLAASGIGNMVGMAGNDLRTDTAVAGLHLCVDTRLAAEQLRAELWLGGRVDGNATREQVRRRIGARHQAYVERAGRYDALADQRRARANDALVSEMERASNERERAD